MTRARLVRPLLFAVALALASAGAAADPESRAARARAELQKRFAAADRDGDGRLTREEARAGMPKVYERFDAIDAGHAGSVSLGDIAAYWMAHRGRATP